MTEPSFWLMPLVQHQKCTPPVSTCMHESSVIQKFALIVRPSSPSQVLYPSERPTISPGWIEPVSSPSTSSSSAGLT